MAFKFNTNLFRFCDGEIQEPAEQWISPLAEISKEERVKDVEEALTFGNHKGATKQPDLLKLLVKNDVIHGFALPLPLDKIARIQGILLTPLNIQAQNTIKDTGRIVPKDRLTHNQSYKWSYSGTSVNSRVDKGELLPCIYGGTIRRLVNWAVVARNKYQQQEFTQQKLISRQLTLGSICTIRQQSKVAPKSQTWNWGYCLSGSPSEEPRAPMNGV